MADQIYVALLNEGVAVWRPVPAWRVRPSRYIVLRPDDYDPELETWEFPPGSLIVVEPRQTSDGEVLAAVRADRPNRQTA